MSQRRHRSAVTRINAYRTRGARVWPRPLDPFAHDHLDGDVRANPTGDSIGVKTQRGTMSDEKAQSEADRVNAEHEREDAEDIRQEAEELRVLAEDARALREQYREQLESLRQEREALRHAAEDARQAAEEARHATIAAVAATADALSTSLAQMQFLEDARNTIRQLKKTKDVD